jgi:transcriptional regulator with XRE-family HTH domain
MGPNQVVAWNLARARELRGWTQDEAAEALAPYIGTRWSKASFSQAERSVTGKVVRRFDAAEIVAFARAFDLPITWFFLPPPALDQDGTLVRLSTPDARRFGSEVALLVDLVFGSTEAQAVVTQRLQGFLAPLGPARLTDAQRQVAALAAQRIGGIARGVLGDVAQWQTWLRDIADHLGDLERQATTAIAPDALEPTEGG